jgi:hypothetical protein
MVHGETFVNLTATLILGTSHGQETGESILEVK